MISQVESFITDFTKVELEARQLDRDKSKREEFNKKLQELESFAIPEMKNRFGLIYKDEFFEEAEFIDYDTKLETPISKELQAVIDAINTSLNKRILFKIETFDNQTSQVYVSVANPQGSIYGQCFIIKLLDGELKIVALYVFTNRDQEYFYWRFGAGDRTVLMCDSEERISVKRINKPDDFRDSLKEHLK